MSTEINPNNGALTSAELWAKVMDEKLSPLLILEIEDTIKECGDEQDSVLSNALRAHLYALCKSLEDYGDVDLCLHAASFTDGWVSAEKHYKLPGVDHEQ